LISADSIGVFLQSQQSIHRETCQLTICVSISVADECISAFNQLRTGPESTRPKFIIYKISDDNKSIVVEETSTAKDYEFFRQKLSAAVDKDGNPAPRYAIYDMEYDLGSEGKR
jgi:cofilin